MGPRSLALLLFLLLGAPPWPVAPAAAQSGTAVADPVAEVRPSDPFRAPPADLLTARRQRLLSAVGEGVVVLKSAATKDIEKDYPQDSDFRQGNDFYYLTGLETPDSWLVLAAGAEGPREILFIPPRNPREEQWTGPKPDPREAAPGSGIQDVRTTEQLARLFPPGGDPAFPPGTPLYVPLNAETRADPVLGRLVFESGAAVRNVEPLLADLRMVKDEFEVEMLRRAIEITVGAQRAAMKAARPSMYEYELEAIIEFNFRLGGAERVGFPSIVGSGPNSVVLHYDKNRRKMEEGDLVVMDVGAEYSYYTADVTRTIPVSGRFTDRQREIYRLVLGAQEAAIAAVRPGVTFGDLTRVAQEHLRRNSGGACGDRGCEAYFIHGLGHWLGMDVHDVGDYTRPLEPGMVLTIEPGIYLPDEDLGVRIEDDVLVTETGYEVLSRDAPREIEEVEALMAEDVALY